MLGGGFIACEMAHVFGSYGAEVTMINRSEHLLRAEDDDVSERFTEVFRERFHLRCGGLPSRIHEVGEEIHIEFEGGDHIVVDELLVATGRIPER